MIPGACARPSGLDRTQPPIPWDKEDWADPASMTPTESTSQQLQH